MHHHRMKNWSIFLSNRAKTGIRKVVKWSRVITLVLCVDEQYIYLLSSKNMIKVT